MERIISTLLPSLVKKGVFGDVDLVNIKSKNDEDIGAQFASSLAFLTLNLKGVVEGGPLDILVKIPASLREDSPSLFQTEFLMYKEVLPAVGFNQEWYPKLHYGIVDRERPEDSFLIFENLKSRKYVNSKSQIFLDYDHISLVMKTLAKFHSLSYILKGENPKQFHELVEKMKKCYRIIPDEMKSEANTSAQSAIRKFEEEHGKEELLEQFFDLQENWHVKEEYLLTPQEPFAVITHGDFCNNNIMYKYDDKGIPIDCAFFDFQTSRYCSPVIDLSFFLYLNTDSDVREKYWDQFLQIYWETLRENVPNHINVPSFESFLKHFSECAVYGFYISTFFMPIMMDPLPFEEMVNLTEEEQNERKNSPKGQETERKLVDLVSHVYHKEYIVPFINYLKKSFIVK